MNTRTNLTRALGGAAGSLLIAALLAAPQAAAAAESQHSALTGVVVDEAVHEALADSGAAEVIVHLREQADLTAVSERFAAGDGVLPGGLDAVDSALTEVRDLLGGITGPIEEILPDVMSTARVAAVVDNLRATVDETAGEVAALLQDRAATGQVRDLQEFWIFNGFAATIDEETLGALTEHPDVASVRIDEVIELTDTAAPPFGVGHLASYGLLATRDPVPWGVERIRAPQAWAEHGTRGEGVVVGILDSGVDGRHPELASSWRGASGDVAGSWYAPTGENYPRPGDRRGHGTHVAGTIVGETLGVAPDAQWIAAKIFRDNGTTNVSVIHTGMQWMLAPGGDPAAAPDVVNSSWGTSASNSTEFWQDLRAWEAAGIVPVFAVGNRGPGAGSLSSPASFPHVVAVGATDSSGHVARYSSRGPVTWDGVRHVKPDLVAPGTRIQSASHRGGSRSMTGTSMAAPHVTGVVALMRSVNPDLPAADVREILTRSARRGGAEPNSTVGHGLVDAVAAMTAARNDS